jgi:hypothetical protein
MPATILDLLDRLQREVPSTLWVGVIFPDNDRVLAERSEPEFGRSFHGARVLAAVSSAFRASAPALDQLGAAHMQVFELVCDDLLICGRALSDDLVAAIVCSSPDVAGLASAVLERRCVLLREAVQGLLDP